MALETEYRGHVIKYDGDRDEFVVVGLAYRSAKLSLCKARVDKFDLELRRIGNVRVLTLGFRNEYEATEATSIDADGKSLYVIRRSGNKTERGKVDLSKTVRDTPENRATFEKANGLRDQARKLEREASALIEAIPRMTVAELRGEAVEYDL